MRSVSLIDLKQAVLSDPRFRDLFPEHAADFVKLLDNPVCSCSRDILMTLFRHPDRLQAYFPDRRVDVPAAVDDRYTVINCHVDDLEKKLNALPHLSYHLAPARSGDQITVILKETAQ